MAAEAPPWAASSAGGALPSASSSAGGALRSASSSGGAPASGSGGGRSASGSGGGPAASLVPYIGSLVSLTVRNTRYEGILADLPEGFSIGLRSVYSLGTEGRMRDGSEIAAGVKVSEYCLFQLCEIKDLKVKPPAPMQHGTASYNVQALTKTHHSQFTPLFSSEYSSGGSISEDANSRAFQYVLQRPSFNTKPPLLQLGNTSSAALRPSAMAFQMPPQYDGYGALNHQISVDHGVDRDAAVNEDDGIIYQNSSRTPGVPELHPRGWSCLKEVDAELSGNGSHNKYRVGSFHFGDRPYSTLFYGEGFLESVIKPSIPKTSTESERGCSTNFFSKPLYSSVYSPGCRTRSSSIGQRFLHFLRRFKQTNSQNPYYKGSVVSMIYEGSCTLKVMFSHIKEHDAGLAAELCCLFESVRRDLNLAAKSFIEEFNNEAEAFCSKKFMNFGDLIVCVDGLPMPNRFVSLEAFSQIPGNHFAEPRNICSGGSSMVVAHTTCVGRVTGVNILQHIFKNHDEKRTWNGKFDLRTIFVTNGTKVEIRAPYHNKFTLDATLNDLIRFVEEVIPLYRIDKIGLPAFFNHLGKYLSRFSASHLSIL